MVDFEYNILLNYFKHLSNTGYYKQTELNKMLLYITILDLLMNDFRGLVNSEDYNIINKALYCLYGSSCLIPFPDYYNNKTKKIMYVGSLSELVHRVEELEIPFDQIMDTPIIVPEKDITEVADLDLEDKPSINV